MEVEAFAGEVKYSLKIPHLSTYVEDDHLSTEFSLSMGGLRSRWQVTIDPFLSVKPNKPHDMNSDIGITLTCLRSNVTFPDIDIYCNVVGRGQAHEKQLKQVRENKEVSGHEAMPSWKGILVPRLALHVFSLLPQDTLTAILRFVVKTDDVWKFSDPLEELSAQLRELRKGKYSDVTIRTTDGASLPAHSLILHARSEWLGTTPHEANTYEEHTTPQSTKHPKTGRKETHLDSTFGTDLSRLSGYYSLSSSLSSGVSSPPSHPESSLEAVKVTSIPPVPSIPTPRRLFAPSQSIRDKRILSPCKSSPIKRPASVVTPSSPRPKILQRENETPRRSPFSPVSCQSVHSSTSSSTPSSKVPLQELEVNTPRSAAAGHTLTVNMSTSVAKAMLDWIYTGECDELCRLAKPLLVGGRRHGVSGLVQACEQHLAATLTPATTPHTLLFAHKYSANSLLSATMKYAVAQAKEVTCQPSWVTVATSAPALITEFSCLLARHTQPDRKR